MNKMKFKNKKRIWIFFGFLVLLIFFILFLKNPNFTGLAINDYNGEKIQKLKLTSMCSFSPEIYRTWRVWNKNDIDVEFNWDIYETAQNGSGIAVANGYSYFNTTNILNNSNTARIFVNNSQHDFKFGSPYNCEIQIPEENQTEPCAENWQCGDWGECVESNQTRICGDLNNCNTSLQIPVLIQDCVFEIPEENSTETNQTEINETEQNLTEENQTEQINETNIVNETETNENITEENITNINNEISSGANGGGGGGGGSRSTILKINSSEENINPLLITGDTNQISGETEEEIKKEIKNEKFINLVGKVIGIPEINSDLSVLIGVIFILVSIIGFLIFKFFKKKFLK